MHVDALVLEIPSQKLRELRIFRRCQVPVASEERDPGAETAVHLSELNADVPAPDDDHGGGEIAQNQRGPIGERLDLLTAGNGRYDATRPGRHNGLLEGQAPVAGVDLMLVEETSFPPHEVNRRLPPVQSSIDRPVDASNDLVLAADGVIQVKSNVAVNLDAEVGCPTGNQVHHLGRAQHGLGGDAPFIDSRAADFFALNQRDRRPQVRGHVRSRKPTLSGSHHQDVIVKGCHAPSSSATSVLSLKFCK